jgi:hypothetical protein
VGPADWSLNSITESQPTPGECFPASHRTELFEAFEIMLGLFRRKSEEHRAKSAATFDELAATAASGKDIDFDARDRLLIATGRTLAEFDAEVERLESRPFAHGMIGDAEKLGPSLEAASKKLAGLQEKEDQVIRQCEQAMSEARSNVSNAAEEVWSIQGRIAQLRTEGRNILLATCDPQLQQQIDRADNRIMALRLELNQV